MNNAAHSVSHRAGRYLQQPAGYRAFIPEPLPPQPPLILAGPLRNRRFRFDPYLRLFEEPEEARP